MWYTVAMTKRIPGHENNPPRIRTKRPAVKAIPTIRRIPDDLWQVIEPLLPTVQKRSPVGRKRVPYRTVMDGILYVLQTGCQWKAVPKEYGSGSTCHKRFQEWVRAGVFRQLWTKLLDKYDDLKGIDWEWQIVDSATVPAPLGGSLQATALLTAANSAQNGASSPTGKGYRSG
jgi:transposase